MKLRHECGRGMLDRAERVDRTMSNSVGVVREEGKSITGPVGAAW